MGSLFRRGPAFERPHTCLAGLERTEGLSRRRQVCEGGSVTEAVEALDILVQQGSYVETSLFYGVLKRCVAQKNLHLGSRVHTLVTRSGYESNAFLANHIICMYASHGRLDEAAQVFSKVHVPSRHMWASIILARTRHGQSKLAIELYRQMQESQVKPDNHIFAAVLKACGTAEDLSSGKEVHADILRTTSQPDMHVCTCLVDMYAKCGSLRDARNVFDNLPTKNVVTWTAMIAGYVQHGLCREALDLYTNMQREGITRANVITFKCLLQACASVGDLHCGKQLHAQIQERGLTSDVVVGTCLLNMFAKCGSVQDAREVFNSLPARDVVTWNAMMAAYVQHGLGQEALDIYDSMQQDGTTSADSATFVFLLQACAIVGALSRGKQFHVQIVESGLEGEVLIGTCLVDMYAKCGSFGDARKVFDNLQGKNVVTWTAMIAGYARHGLGQEALDFYSHMQREGVTFANPVTFVSLLQACSSVAGLEKGKEIHAEIFRIGISVSDLFVASSLIDMYAKCGSMVDAQRVFDALPTRDIVTWNALIAGYSRQGESKVVFDLLQKMKLDDIQPNSSTFVSVLTVCSHLGLLETGQKYFRAMHRDYGITPGIEHYTCMVDLFGRVGCVDMAMKIVKKIPCQPDSEIWKCMLGACQKWGALELAREAFECAVKLDKSDPVAYVLMSNILAAAHQSNEATEIQAMRWKAQAWKRPGESWWTDSDGLVHAFMVGNDDCRETKEIYANLKDLFITLRETGFLVHVDSVFRDAHAEEEETGFCGHSNKLAAAHALVKIQRRPAASLK